MCFHVAFIIFDVEYTVFILIENVIAIPRRISTKEIIFYVSMMMKGDYDDNACSMS